MSLQPGAPAPTTDLTGAPQEAAKPEAQQADAPKAESPEELALKGRFAQLARREKMIMQQKRQLAEERAKWEQQRQQQQAPDDSWKKHLSENPMDFLAQNGITYDKLTEQMLNSNPTEQTLRLMQQKLAAIEAENQQFKQQMTQSQEQSYNQAVKQMGTDVKNLVAASPEFEAISAAGEDGVNAVVELIRATFDEEGYIMDMHEAVQLVEEELTEQYVNIAKLKKVQSKLTPTQAAAQEMKEAPKSINTLSHSGPAPVQSKGLTAKERRERAIMVFKHGPEALKA